MLCLVVSLSHFLHVSLALLLHEQTAHFIIPRDIQHGQDLICSHEACRNGGVKFCYCTFCRIPVAKRNFRIRHIHADEIIIPPDDAGHLPATHTESEQAVVEGNPIEDLFKPFDQSTNVDQWQLSIPPNTKTQSEVEYLIAQTAMVKESLDQLSNYIKFGQICRPTSQKGDMFDADLNPFPVSNINFGCSPHATPDRHTSKDRDRELMKFPCQARGMNLEHKKVCFFFPTTTKKESSLNNSLTVLPCFCFFLFVCLFV